MGGQAGDRAPRPTSGVVPARGTGQPDPALLRISDQDRHAVAEVLRHAAGEGRIDLDELDERLEATYAAKTYADLVPITADLPAANRPGRSVAPAAPPVPPPVPAADGVATRYGTSVAVMSETKRRGVWEVPDRSNAVAVMGSVVLDMREARFEAQECVVDAVAIMGSVEVVVDPGTRVLVDGVGIMGDFSEGRAKVSVEPDVQTRVVRVRGLALMGSVVVRRKDLPGPPRRRLGRG